MTMLAKDVQIGATYRCRVGDRLALVTVLAAPGRGHRKFTCQTQDTDRRVLATAAKLRPIPGTALDEAEQARKRKAHARRVAATPVGTYNSTPVLPEPVLVAPSPVAGMVGTVNPRQPVERLVGHNRAAVERIVAGVHVGLPWSSACRAVYRVVGTRGRLHSFARHLRRGLWLKVAEEHASNRRLYLESVGHAPIPSEDVVAAAMTGDEATRAAVLAS
jgi:hypothetical protein